MRKVYIGVITTSYMKTTQTLNSQTLNGQEGNNKNRGQPTNLKTVMSVVPTAYYEQHHPLRHSLKTLVRCELLQARSKHSIKTLMSGLGVVCL